MSDFGCPLLAGCTRKGGAFGGKGLCCQQTQLTAEGCQAAQWNSPHVLLLPLASFQWCFSYIPVLRCCLCVPLSLILFPGTLVSTFHALCSETAAWLPLDLAALCLGIKHSCCKTPCNVFYEGTRLQVTTLTGILPIYQHVIQVLPPVS